MLELHALFNRAYSYVNCTVTHHIIIVRTFLTIGNTNGSPLSVAYMPIAMFTLLGLGSALQVAARPNVMSIGAIVNPDHSELLYIYTCKRNLLFLSLDLLTKLHIVKNSYSRLYRKIPQLLQPCINALMHN